jgi:acetyl-CoA acetyltransferase
VEGLAKLRTVFAARGSVTAGDSSETIQTAQARWCWPVKGRSSSLA